MRKLLVFGITCMILGAALNLFLLIASKAAGQQQKQQPQFTNQFAQQQREQQQQQQLQQQQLNQPRFPNKRQQGQVLDQRKQQQQLLNQNQHQGQPLYNANQVIACLNHQLADSIVKAGITGALTLHNNTNGTVTAALNQTFIMNATNVLDSCILPRR
jgi:predicted RND superfamily exporter protein